MSVNTNQIATGRIYLVAMRLEVVSIIAGLSSTTESNINPVSGTIAENLETQSVWKNQEQIDKGDGGLTMR